MWVRRRSFTLPFFEFTPLQFNYGPPATITGTNLQMRVELHTDDLDRYLKQEIESAGERFIRVLWHPEDSSKLLLATSCARVFFLARRVLLMSHLSPDMPTDI